MELTAVHSLGDKSRAEELGSACPEALCSHVPDSASPRLVTAWKTHTGFALADLLLSFAVLISFAGDREHGLELSRVSGCRVKSMTLLQGSPALYS